MKKALGLFLLIALLVSSVALTACSAGNVKIGVGIATTVEKVTDADGEDNGEGKAMHTVAAVMVDENGKIIKCVIDAVEGSVKYTSAGTVVAGGEYKTKGELGDDYNMKAYGGAALEWYEQADAFEALCVGKDVAGVKALIAATGYGTEEVISAGCTIAVSDFAVAIERAVNAAQESTATKDDTLALGIVSAFSASDSKNATDDADGKAVFNTAVAASAKDASGKVTAAILDDIAVTFTFDKTGEGTTATTAKFTSKRALGADYKMAQYGTDLNGDGVVKEWFEQADVLAANCIGMTKTQIEAVVVNGYANETIQTAGCTIAVSSLVKALVKSVG